jgi:N-acetylmuramoyl-L-alanine amidase
LNRRWVVVVDPGHGGPDPGAVGIGGLRETDLTLDVSRRIVELLQQQGVETIITRTGEQDVDLDPRVRIAERAHADLFVSIHINSLSMDRPDVNGTESYYYSDSGLQLAQVLQHSMTQVPQVQDRGIHHANFYVIKYTSMPATLLELGFITGSSDAALLGNSNFRGQMATAIASGILQYMQQHQ